jgi:dihydropyrimidinase
LSPEGEVIRSEGSGLGKTSYGELNRKRSARCEAIQTALAALAVGFDADIVLLDPRQRKIVWAAELREADYKPWEGHDFAAWPSPVMLRRQDRRRRNTFTGDLKDGQSLSRKVPEEIRSRPAV